MTLDQWRQNDALVAWAHNLMLTREWHALMAVMSEEHPMYKINVVPGFSEPDNSKALGIISGWNQFATTLKLAGTVARPQHELVATFAPSEVEVEQQPEKPSVKRRNKR